MITNSDIYEFHKSTKERQNQLALEESAKNEALVKEKHDFYSKYFKAKDKRSVQESARNNNIMNSRSAALSTCIKAIYITALEAETLTDEGVLLAESLVDNYISQKGGAEKVFAGAKETYLNATLARIVEDAAEDDAKEIEKIDVESLGEDEGKEEDKKEEASDKKEDKKDEDKKEESEEDKSDEKKEDEGDVAPEEDAEAEKEDDDDSDDEPDDDDESDEDKDEDLRKVGSDDELADSDDDNESDEDDDIDSKLDDSEPEKEEKEKSDEDDDKDIDSKLDDGKEEVVIDNDDKDNGSKDASINDTNDEGEVTKTIYDELENEEDVQKAVEIIKTRVADAEEAFIKRNAEDKQKMDELLGKISDNVKTVEQIADNDSGKSKVAQEHVNLARQEIGKIHNKPQSVFEAVVRNLSSSIVKNDEVRANYVNESGKLDVTSVLETAKVMYAFLETLNTLQLEKVDEAYIGKVLEEIKSGK